MKKYIKMQKLPQKYNKKTLCVKKMTYQWSQICKEHLDLPMEVFWTKILWQSHHSQFCNSTWCCTEHAKIMGKLLNYSQEKIIKMHM